MWRKLPVWLRAVLTGLVVTAIPTTAWAVLAVINLRRTPNVPWAAPVMAVVLWLYWRLLRKHEGLRAVRLTAQVWRLSLIAGGAAVAAVWASLAALRGILNIAAPKDDVTRFPILLVAASIVMGSIVAACAKRPASADSCSYRWSARMGPSRPSPRPAS